MIRFISFLFCFFCLTSLFAQRSVATLSTASENTVLMVVMRSLTANSEPNLIPFCHANVLDTPTTLNNAAKTTFAQMKTMVGQYPSPPMIAKVNKATTPTTIGGVSGHLNEYFFQRTNGDIAPQPIILFVPINGTQAKVYQLGNL